MAPEARVAIAQAANDLLRIQGVDASFVAVQVGNGVNAVSYTHLLARKRRTR